LIFGGGLINCNPILAQSFRHGVYVGYETNVEIAVPLLQAANLNTVRLWADIDWNQHTQPIAFQQAGEFKARGFHVILLLQNKNVPSYEQAKAYFDWVQRVPGLKDAVDQWEILNEINLKKYWLGTPKEYVQNVLQAAWDSLAPTGEIVIGASTTTWQVDAKSILGINTSYNQALREAGYLKYVHFANIHPYAYTVNDMKKYITEVRTIYDNKPILATEWNFKRMDNWDSWVHAINEIYPFLRANLAGVYYYRLLQSPSEGGWPGLAKPSYQPQQPFYQAWKLLAGSPRR
jgi:hypothetical protein